MAIMRVLSYILKNALIFLLITNTACASAKLFKAQNFKQINNTLLTLLKDKNPEKVALIFPLENVVLESKVLDISILKNKELRSSVKNFNDSIKLSRKSFMQEVLLTEYENDFVDPFFPEFIKNIQKYKIPIIATTKNISGSFNDIDFLELWTHDFLVQKGVDLSKSKVGDKRFKFDMFFKKSLGSHPSFYNGLLSGNVRESNHSINNLIATFFATKIRWYPDVVYVVDTSKNKINNLARALKAVKKDIQIYGFIFTPIKDKELQYNKKDFKKFIQEYRNKINSVTRKEFDASKEDPYEQ